MPVMRGEISGPSLGMFCPNAPMVCGETDFNRKQDGCMTAAAGSMLKSLFCVFP